MNSLIKGILIFTGGLAVGGGVGATISYFVTKRRAEKECSDEIAALRKHYEDVLERYEALEPDKEDSDISKNDDGIVTVGEGVPADKKVNTHKTAYEQAYKKETKLSPEVQESIRKAKENIETMAPSEDDDEEEDIVEITTFDDKYTGEPGYGQKSGYYAIEMAYYTKDEGMEVTDWGEMNDGSLERDDMMIANEEDEIIYDILPYLKEVEFGHKPYDEIYLRNNKRSIDIHLVKRYSSSQPL